MKKIHHAWCIDNGGVPVTDNDVKRFLSVRPSERQLKWNEMKYYNFIHFGINTFTDSEWGNGNEDISLFNPEALNTDEWCSVLKASGSKGIIITAKHHDGFCLFDSKYTDHNVMNTPYGRDIISELSKSCKKYSLGLGIYLSPWDMHEKTYGTEEYNDYFTNQLKELCTGYGEIFCFWFDGACGEGKNGKKQHYAWDRYYSVIRELQPNAVIANCGPDVRWIGNECGKERKSEWSVIARTADTLDGIAKNSQHKDGMGITSFDRTDKDLGSRSVIKDKAELCWCPAEADVSVTSGWFWHEDEYYKKKHRFISRTPKELAEIYFKTVGGNAALLLNVPVDNRGLISEREKDTLKRFSDIIKASFAETVPYSLTVITADMKESMPDTDSFMLLDGEAGACLYPVGKFRTMVIEEDIKYGQRIESFDIFADSKKTAHGTTVGSCKIIRFPNGFEADEIIFVVTQSRGNPIIKSIKLYK